MNSHQTPPRPYQVQHVQGYQSPVTPQQNQSPVTPQQTVSRLTASTPIQPVATPTTSSTPQQIPEYVVHDQSPPTQPPTAADPVETDTEDQVYIAKKHVF